VMLDTGVKPYTDVADLLIIDPDGYIIRYSTYVHLPFDTLLTTAQSPIFLLFKG
jgi:hypothetical protein